MANEAKQTLLKAMAGESLARNKYTYYAQIATKQDQIWIARIFEETADNERAHAKEEMENLTEHTEMTNTYDIHPLADTLTNLRNAEAGEVYEYTKMYPEFEKIAREQGDKKAADLYAEIAKVEEKHAERFKKIGDLLEAGKLYKSEEEIEWKCLNCGHIHKGKSAPDSCPLCKKKQGWFMGIGVVR